MAVSGGELLIDVLQGYGIEYAFCSPGSEWVSLWEGISRRCGQGVPCLKYINCRHELLAVTMAIGYNRATGRMPAVLLHAGVGPLNTAMALRTAALNRVPMLICSGEANEHSLDDATRSPGPHWLGFLADIGGPAALVRPYVKWSNAVTSLDGLLDSVYRGCQIAAAEPPGPVFISIAGEVLLKPATEAKATPLPPPPPLPEPAAADLDEAARQLLESQHPVIIAEHAGQTPEAVSGLVALAELVGIPVYECTYPTHASFPKDHPLYLGDDASEALKEADTILLAGALVPWYPPAAHPRQGARVIHIDDAPRHERLPYWGYHVDLTLAGDIERGLALLGDAVRRRLTPDDKARAGKRLEQWRPRHEEMTARWEKEASDGQNASPVSTSYFLHTLNRLLPADTLVLDETQIQRRLLQRYLAAPGRYIRVDYGSLGVGLGEAGGVKLACPDKPVVFILGDGTFNYSPVMAGLGLCQEYGLPVFIVIFNNGGYGAMKPSYRRFYPEGWAHTNKAYLGVNISPQPDYAAIAAAFGGYGERVEEPGEVEPAIRRALEQLAGGRTVLLDVIVGSEQ